ncbi:hypothetical protein [Providencia rettgeri]|uniref:hypothetical protein n=1 Tax=Providencia rettgeri TaxID=587 RepID=UPI00301007E6
MPTKFNLEDLWIICFSVLCVCILIYSIIDLIKILMKKKVILNDLPFKGLGVQNQFDEKIKMIENKKIILCENHVYFPDGELVSWIEEGELDIELYMSEEQIGRLVKQYMIKTNGMPLKIVFPEYDKGDLNEKYFKI